MPSAFYPSGKVRAIFRGAPMRIQPYSAADINEHVMPIALRYELTIYDSLYLHLASALGLPLLTLDRHLADAARQAGVAVI
jgi:predicted nucleic acid-binding protein